MDEEEKKDAPEAESDVENDENDTSDKDRTTQQFEKLTKANKLLKQERDALKDTLTTLKTDPAPAQPAPSASQYDNLSQTQVDSIYDNMVDGNGYVDMNVLKQALKQADGRANAAMKAAQQAEQRAQQAEMKQRDFEESNAIRRVYKKYPQLNPKDSQFDKDYYEAVRGEVVLQLADRKKEDIMAAADKWHNRLFTKSKKDNKKEREDIASTPSGSRAGRNKWDRRGYEDLIQGTRKGNSDAISERLRRSGY